MLINLGHQGAARAQLAGQCPPGRRLTPASLGVWRRQPSSGGREGRGPDDGVAPNPSFPPQGTSRNPRWRGMPPPPPPPQPSNKGSNSANRQQQKQPWQPQFQLRSTVRRLYQNERLRALVEQDVEEQHRGRWGPDPTAAEQAGAEEADWPVQGPLDPPSWLDLISGNAEAQKAMEWVQQQREERRRRQEKQIDNQVSLLAWVYLVVAVVIVLAGSLAQL